jgi:hypothetical protein
MSDIFTQEIKDLLKLATTDFDKFYAETEKKSKASGDYSKAASSGNSSTAASSGNSSTAASSGYYSTAASSGYYSACSALGYRAAVKGDLGNLLMASEYVIKDNKYIPVGGKADIVDGKIIKPNFWYIVEGGEWVEVDFSDGVFGRVVSTKGNIKKLKTDNGKIIYLATDGNNTAHGDTVKEALSELAFKCAEKDVSKYKNMPKSTKHTPEDWAIIYRAVTGACRIGCKMFIESQGKMKKKYTLAEIIDLTKGQYRHDVFVKTVTND